MNTTSYVFCAYSFLTGSGRDFLVLNRDLTITATSSDSRECFNITIIDDSIIEDTEFFRLSLISTSDNVTVLSSLATVFLRDNDGRYECMEFKNRST